MPSQIDPSRFADGQPVSKVDLRAALSSAKAELEHGGFNKTPRPGAVERKALDKMGDFVSVKDFGALGDGAGTTVGTAWIGAGRRYADLTAARTATGIADLGLTDTVDWAAFQAALNLGVMVDVPVGVYLINRTLYAHHILLRGVKGKGWSGSNLCRINTTGSFGQEPMFRTQPRWFDWAYAAQGSGSWVGGSFYLADLAFTNSDPEGCVAQFLSVAGVSKIERCWISSAGRGVALGGCYETSVENCYFTGFLAYGGRQTGWAASGWAEGVGLYAHNHCAVRATTFAGCGVGLCAQGYGIEISGCRAEENVLGYRIGLGTYVNNDAGVPFMTNFGFLRSSFHACSGEANRYGVSAKLGRASSMRDIEVQGSTNRTPGSRGQGGTGFDFSGGMRESACVENISTFGGFEEGGAILLPGGHGSTFNCRNWTFAQSNATRPGLARSTYMVTENPNRTRPEYSLIRLPMSPTLQGSSNTGGSTTAFHDLQLRGLKGLNVAKANIQPNNLGGIVTVANGATTAVVTFGGRVTRNDATTFTVVNDGASTLPAGTYYYGATYLAARGETGLDTLDSTPPYKTRVVGSGQKVTLSMSRGADYTTRVYRGTASGQFDGYWQAPYGSGAYTMHDDGAVPFDGVDLPPPNGSWIPSQAEADALYAIVATPSWNTSVWVTSKATSGFTLNFGSAAPVGASAQWLLFRP